MSLAKLNAVHASLPCAKRGIEHVRLLRESAGRRIKAAEATRFREILSAEWKAFDPAARRALEMLAGRAAPDLRPIRFGKPTVHVTGVDEQSALAYLGPRQGFVTVSDDSPVIHRIVVTRGRVQVDRLVPENDTLRGLEGCAYHEARKWLLVVSEDSRRMWRLAVNLEEDIPRLGKLSKVGRLPAMGRRGNKGWEGLTVLEASVSPDRRAHILVVHEKSPRAIGIFHPASLALEGFVEIPPDLGEHPMDLSDVAVDRTGRLFVLSDESNAVFQMELRHGPAFGDGAPSGRQWGLVSVGQPMWLPGRGGHPQAEGICFDQRGDLWIACEMGSRILHLPRVR